ncbi:phytanoyl-CoA dioxygenase family protein [Pontibacterium sp.]|uniref:phytanoyl-CoA dioxygenase family protein n=1 Tax=Pontibacterium sp. TaxID=2036026 RepID=UPI00351306FB
MSAFDYQGYEHLSGVLPMEQVNRLRDALAETPLEQKAGEKSADKVFPIVQELVSDPNLMRIAESYLTGIVSIVQVKLFESTPAKAWHQERNVVLNQKVDIADWGPWHEEDGVHYVQPPIEVLDNMVTLRLQLDAANEESGYLRIIPRSHNTGLMSEEEIAAYAESHESIDCFTEAGDVLAIRPHVLHKTCEGSSGSSRRVLQIEYCGYKLPAGLEWA